MKKITITSLQGSLHASYAELLAAFGSPFWGGEKEICHFRTGGGGYVYMRSGQKKACAISNNDWAIGGASPNILDEVRSELRLDPGEKWRISSAKSNRSK